MNRPVKITSRPQLALQSYLDSLLMDATEELAPLIEALRRSESSLKVPWTSSRWRCSKSRLAMRDLRGGCSACGCAVMRPWRKRQRR